MGMVTADLYRSTDGLQRAFESMDLKVLIPAAALVSGGMFVAQEAIERVEGFGVVPGLDSNPSDMTGYGTNFGVKMVFAIALVYGATKAGSRAISGLATALAIGVLGSAGLDLWELGQSAAGQGSSSSAPRRSRTVQSASRTRTATASASPSRSTTTSSSNTSASSPRSRRREQEAWG